MMTGNVFNRHVLISVTFRLPNRPDLAIEFVVDTGFTDYLSLPVAAVTALGLPYAHDVPASLATDTPVVLPAHEATVLWNGTPLDVRVIAMGSRPLLGTAMLDGHELVAQFADHGLVTIDSL